MVSYYRRGFQLLVLAILMTCFSGAVQAQYPQYLLETGTPTFSTPETVPQGFINMANGNLHIEIPFVSTSQRGGRSVVGAMVYDSRIWKIVDNGSSQSWQPTNVHSVYPEGGYAVSGWRFVGTGEQRALYDTVAHECYYGGNPYNWYEYKNYRFSDLSGTLRRFPLYNETSNACHTAGTTTSSGPALDATGALMKLDTGSGYEHKPGEVIGPDGTTVWKYVRTGNSVVWKDPNGNYMDKDLSSGTVTDTPIGRS